jgi:histidinol-phosphatase
VSDTNQLDGHDLALELAFALRLAEAADAITLPHYERRSFTLDWKANRTEVTEADRNAELAIAALVLEERPHHGLYGEEHGVVGDESSPWRWVIDPIDGTSNFVRGIPVWASLIALTHDVHGAVVGVVSAPAMQRRWFAARGLGATVPSIVLTRHPMASKAVLSMVFAWLTAVGPSALIASAENAWISASSTAFEPNCTRSST